MKSKLTDNQKHKIATLYIDGKSSSFLAEKFDVSTTTIFKVLNALKVTIRPRGRVPQTAS